MITRLQALLEELGLEVKKPYGVFDFSKTRVDYKVVALWLFPKT